MKHLEPRLISGLIRRIQIEAEFSEMEVKEILQDATVNIEKIQGKDKVIVRGEWGYFVFDFTEIVMGAF